MSETTKIEWADRTFNPWEGCTKVSPGCANCYAEARNKRFSGGANWGKGKPRRRTSATTWRNPVKWNVEAFCSTLRHARVFPSLCDWLDDEVPIEWLADFLKLIHDTPNLDWVLLTKRPENWRPRVTRLMDLSSRSPVNKDDKFWHWLADWTVVGVPGHIWIGVSVEDQPRADERIQELLKIPAAVRFLSVEPLLSPVDIERAFEVYLRAEEAKGGCAVCAWPRLKDYIHWVIVGNESLPGKRVGRLPHDSEEGFHFEARTLMHQCRQGVKFFMKQLPINGKTSGDPAEWPADLRVREFPVSQKI